MITSYRFEFVCVALLAGGALACGDSDPKGGASGSGPGATDGTAGSGLDAGAASQGSPTADSTPADSSASGTVGSVGSSTGTLACEGPGVRGRVLRDTGEPIVGARVTLVGPGPSEVMEARTDAAGDYAFSNVADGDYVLGASSPQRQYSGLDVVVATDCLERDFELGPETEGGNWTTLSDTAPEFFAGTPSGTLLPDGRVLFCHDTQDGVIIDPADGSKTYAAASPTSQGCHMQTTLTDGRVLFVGGQDPEDPGSFVNGIAYVKTYDPATDTWAQLPDLNEPRWYPSLFRLPDETIIACGGGQPPDATRTDTCERFNLQSETWTPVGSMLNPTEYSPTLLLQTGEVLATWSPPQLFDPVTEQWRATGDFVQSPRSWPGHSDHSLVLLPSGEAAAIGVLASTGSAMVERYDPQTETWSLGASPNTVRSKAEIVQLPDGRIMAAGGFWEGGEPVRFDPAWRAVPTTDLYDPEDDSWRPVADMLRAREYHALTLLLPDGRVITTSGGSDQASGAGNNNDVDVFEPPYLFRGPRPVLDTISTTDLSWGDAVDVMFSGTDRPTAVVAVGTHATTHWVDGGVSRRASLDFRVGDQGSLTFDVPSQPVQMPAGWYILFLLVDDIPSQGVLVRVVP